MQIGKIEFNRSEWLKIDMMNQGRERALKVEAFAKDFMDRNYKKAQRETAEMILDMIQKLYVDCRDNRVESICLQIRHDIKKEFGLEGG